MPQGEFIYTSSNGAPAVEPYAAQRAGLHGPLLLQDFHHIDLLAHFDRERIPERVVHAKGAGAHGYFEVTHDLSDITSQKLFHQVGNRVDATVRFSTVGGESGSADTARDPRGFAVKLKTDEGNWDWVFNNTPIFFIRDPAKFPHFIHTQKRNPQTHLKDADMFWDYLSSNPESIHQILILFSDRGTPNGYHNEHGYSGHTFKWCKEDGSFVYVKVHLLTDNKNGFETLSDEEATRLAGEDPDYGTRLLFEAIEAGNFPSWTVHIQTMTPEQAERFRYNVLDLTKVWPHDQFRLRPIGKLVLDKNPENYFAEIEQAAFSPSYLIPYIEPSADPVLQSRLFSYPDTHRYRLGVNYQQLPINAPKVNVANFQRDGFATHISQGNRANYPSSTQSLKYVSNKGTLEGSVNDHERSSTHEAFIGAAWRSLSEVTELDFEQPRVLWRTVWSNEQRKTYIRNVANHIKSVKNPEIIDRQLAVFAAVDLDLADGIAKAVGRSPVPPLKVKPATEAVSFCPNIGGVANLK
ncbi:hypothetical protein APHAL10511_000230 [Amanita phalloides]|nr:hypothetical protein APHAL10511_000230 [Amanita phalloides]